MKRVYDLNKNKNYQIELNINTVSFVEENEIRQKISSVHSGTFNFPDDTETKLTQIWTEIHENGQYLLYLEEKLNNLRRDRDELASKLRQSALIIEKLESEKERGSLWYRLRCALANRKL